MQSKITSIQELLQHNQLRLAALRARPFFAILSENVLSDPRKRDVFLACVQRFSTNFQTLLFLRQGLCADVGYQSIFLRHLQEELGHDQMLPKRSSPTAIQDTIFEAVLGWFNYQMIVRDNSERAALMHLVLEAAGDLLHSAVAPVLRRFVDSPYFDTHSDLDAGHAEMGLELLADETVSTYNRLASIVDSGWDMMEAITDRILHLVMEVPDA